MKPKNLAIGVAVLAALAIALNFINKPAGSSGVSADKQKVRGRALLTPENEELLEKAQEVVIQAQKTLYINDILLFIFRVINMCFGPFLTS